MHCRVRNLNDRAGSYCDFRITTAQPPSLPHTACTPDRDMSISAPGQPGQVSVRTPVITGFRSADLNRGAARPGFVVLQAHGNDVHVVLVVDAAAGHRVAFQAIGIARRVGRDVAVRPSPHVRSLPRRRGGRSGRRGRRRHVLAEQGDIVRDGERRRGRRWLAAWAGVGGQALAWAVPASAVGGSSVGVGGAGVSVGGTGVSVGGGSVAVGGTAVAVEVAVAVGVDLSNGAAAAKSASASMPAPTLSSSLLRDC